MTSPQFPANMPSYSVFETAKEITSDIGKGTATISLMFAACVALVIITSGCLSIKYLGTGNDYDTIEAKVITGTCTDVPLTQGMFSCDLTVSYTYKGTLMQNKPLNVVGSRKYAKDDSISIEVLKSDSNVIRTPQTNFGTIGYYLVIMAIFLIAVCGGSWWYITHTQNTGITWILILLGLCTISAFARFILK